MNKKRLGAFIFLFAILIISLNTASALSDPNRSLETGCSEVCIPSNNFISGTSANSSGKATCENSDGKYFRSFTDYYKTGNKTEKEIKYCCCTGEVITLTNKDTGNTFSSGNGNGLINLDADGILQWISAYESGSEVSTTFIKYLILILVFVLSFSSFNIVKFPEEAYLRGILSVVMAILFTIVISPEELIGAMINFKSVGLTMILAFPIFVLAMFSFAMAVQVNSMGIVLQRVIWGIYSIFLFINSGLVLLAKKTAVAPDSIFASLYKLADTFGGSYFSGAEITTTTTLFLASIIIFFTMVVFNKKLITLLTAEVRAAKLAKYGDISEKAEAKKKLDAKAVDNA